MDVQNTKRHQGTNEYIFITFFFKEDLQDLLPPAQSCHLLFKGMRISDLLDAYLSQIRLLSLT